MDESHLRRRAHNRCGNLESEPTGFVRSNTYMADLGSAFQDEPGSPSDDRPRLQGPRQPMELMGKPVPDRLPDVIITGFDMQFTSYSNVTRYVSHEEAECWTCRISSSFR